MAVCEHWTLKPPVRMEHALPSLPQRLPVGALREQDAHLLQVALPPWRQILRSISDVLVQRPANVLMLQPLPQPCSVCNHCFRDALVNCAVACIP